MSLPDRIYVRVNFEGGKRRIIDMESSLEELEVWQRDQILELLSHAPDEVYINSSGRYRGYKLEKPSKGSIFLANGVSNIDYTYIAANEERPETE